MNIADQAAEWLSITEIATLRARDKGGVSRRVSKLEAQGLLRTRRGPAGSKLVDVTEYDRVVGETLDLQHEVNGRAGRKSEPQTTPTALAPEADPVHLGREQARRARAAAEMMEMNLAERRGKLIETDRVLAATASCAQAIVQTAEQWPSRADEVTAAVLKDGVAGARVVMVTLVRELLDELARRMTLIAVTAPVEAVAEEAADA